MQIDCKGNVLEVNVLPQELHKNISLFGGQNSLSVITPQKILLPPHRGPNLIEKLRSEAAPRKESLIYSGNVYFLLLLKLNFIWSTIICRLFYLFILF